MYCAEGDRNQSVFGNRPFSAESTDEKQQRYRRDHYIPLDSLMEDRRGNIRPFLTALYCVWQTQDSKQRTHDMFSGTSLEAKYPWDIDERDIRKCSFDAIRHELKVLAGMSRSDVCRYTDCFPTENAARPSDWGNACLLGALMKLDPNADGLDGVPTFSALQGISGGVGSCIDIYRGLMRELADTIDIAPDSLIRRWLHKRRYYPPRIFEYEVRKGL